jgi:hypothetical protein
LFVAVTETEGAIVFEVKITVAMFDVQPLVVPTREYVPAIFTPGVAELPPEIIPGPLHVYVVTPDPFKVAVVFIQVRVCVVPAAATGTALTVTFEVAEVELTHPAALVPVTE